MKSIRERLEEVYRRLHLLPSAMSANEAWQQLCDTIDAVEDEFSEVEKQNPPPWLSNIDGRMYCPLDDHITHLDGGGILAMTRGHRIEIESSGRFRIVNRLTGNMEFEK